MQSHNSPCGVAIRTQDSLTPMQMFFPVSSCANRGGCGGRQCDMKPRELEPHSCTHELCDLGFGITLPGKCPFVSFKRGCDYLLLRSPQLPFSKT